MTTENTEQSIGPYAVVDMLSWQPDQRDNTPWLRLHTQGRGLSRLNLSGRNDSDAGEPLVVQITVMSADVEEPHVSEVTIEWVGRPTRLRYRRASAVSGQPPLRSRRLRLRKRGSAGH